MPIGRHCSRLAAVAALAAAVGCSSSSSKRAVVPIGDGADSGSAAAAADRPRIEMPDIPATLNLTSIAPDDGHQPGARSPLIDLMAAENKRWFAALEARAQFPAFFLAHHVRDQKSVSITAEGGAILGENEDETRVLDVEVRVGSPELDNRRPLKNNRLAFLANLPREARMPFGTDPEAVKQHLWLETDRRYRDAVMQLKQVLNNQNVMASSGKRPPDFSREKAKVFIQKPATLDVDREAWTRKVRACSLAAERGVATRAVCSVSFELNTTYYVNSEGAALQRSWTEATLTISVGVKADDGMPLSRVEIVYSPSPDGLPDIDELEPIIERVAKDLTDLHGAPVVDPYSGPAILRGRAAAVFFHEVFGHRIEGHRQKDETSGQTFSSKLGKQIMPEWLSVFDDPTVRELNGTPLHGFYHYDDEGVPAQRATLVERGVLKGFVQGRNPLDGFPSSNGHGRRQPGLPAVSRQGNLIVKAERSVTDENLKKLLIEEIKRQKKPYGMMFTDISGGFTNTSKFAPQSFKVNPIMSYRVFADGREELVRGVDIEGTPLIALGSIVAASRDMEIFNGMCGAESGWVPVSASAPSLLLTTLEVARSEFAGDTSPSLPPPSLQK